MKKAFVFILSIMIFTSCATAKKKEPPKFPNLTVDNVQKQCAPVERWNVNVLGIPAQVIRFDDCLEFKDLLLIGMYSEGVDAEIRDMSSELLSLHYLEYLKREEKEKDTGRIWNKRNLKLTVEDEWATRFIELKFKVVECTDKTCREITKP